MIERDSSASWLGDPPAVAWERLEQVIDLALDAPPREREALVQAWCGDDRALHEAALAWMRACVTAPEQGRTAEERARLLDRPVAASMMQAALDAASRDSHAAHDGAVACSSRRCAGTRIGPWRLLREIGRGGMGVVYLAERADGDVSQRVALKFMHHADALDAVGRRRFHDERRILAALAHPAIARLVDVGIDDDVPWLAMEYVAGQPLDRWCEARALSIEARIALFCEVADAVQHAHARLVVHRDLKPANILVADDGRPTLLDFGIAKLLDASGLQAGASTSLDTPHRGPPQTRPGWQPMTPAYASPEQRRGDPSSITSDVYALGVLLHELLTGALPLAGVLPSARISGGEDARRRARRLRGDLDTIITRAIDEEPTRRYPTAEALATDLRRHLRGLPVHARRDAAFYRLRKLVGRHPATFAVAAGALIVATTFTIITAAQSRQLRTQAIALREQAATLRRERDKARAVTQFLTEVLSSADPYRPGAGARTLRDVLDRGTQEIERRLHDRPEIRAQLYSAVAPAWFGLGDWERAGDAAAAAVALRRQPGPAHDPELAASLVYLASVRLNQARAVEAEHHAREALSMFRARGTTLGDDSLSALSALGASLQKQGRRREAGEVLASVLRTEQTRADADPARLAQFERNLAHVLRDDGRYPAATALYARAYAHHLDAFGIEHPESGNSAVNLGYAHFLSGNVTAALPLLRRGVAIKRRLLGLANPDVAGDQLTLARVLHRAGHIDDARRLRTEAEAALRASVR